MLIFLRMSVVYPSKARCDDSLRVGFKPYLHMLDQPEKNCEGRIIQAYSAAGYVRKRKV
jgi:hypothetical protein